VVESVTREVTEYGRKAADDAFALARSFADVRSPDDLLRVQNQFAKAAFDNAMFFSKNVTEALRETADEVAVAGKTASSTDPLGK
jgi:phasin family protein